MSTTPILDRLIADGHAYIDKYGTIVGIATDGTEASLGQTHARAAAERYLTDFPSPEMW